MQIMFFFIFHLFSTQNNHGILLNVTQAGTCLYLHCAKQRLYMRDLEINNVLTHKL